MLSYAHGGSCCGMRHLYGFPSTPETMVNALPRKSGADMRLYPRPLPKQTGAERFETLMTHIKATQRKVIVEAVLVDMLYNKQYTGWKDYLENYGFEEVTSGVNSNTGNTLHVFHYVIDTPAEEFHRLERAEYKMMTEDAEIQKKERAEQIKADAAIPLPSVLPV